MAAEGARKKKRSLFLRILTLGVLVYVAVSFIQLQVELNQKRGELAMLEKQVEDQRSVTNIRKLTEKESVEELARMLGGASITENVRNNAREMKDLARKSKQY